MSAPERWSHSPSDQGSNLPIEEDIAHAYIDGRNEGRRDERARIRRELRALIWDDARGQFNYGGELWSECIDHTYINESALLEVLDYICPEGN